MSIINNFPLLIPDFYITCSIMVCKIRPLKLYKWCHPVGHPNLYDFKGFEIFKNYLKLEGQWPWIPRELQQFVDAGWSVFTMINFGNNELFCE